MAQASDYEARFEDEFFSKPSNDDFPEEEVASRKQSSVLVSPLYSEMQPLGDSVSSPTEDTQDNGSVPATSPEDAGTSEMKPGKTAAKKAWKTQTYLAIAFAKSPMEKYKEVCEKDEKRLLEDEFVTTTNPVAEPEAGPAGDDSSVKTKGATWGKVRGSMLSEDAQEYVGRRDVNKKRISTGKLAMVMMALEGNPKKKELLERLKKKEAGDFDGLLEKLENELMITGEFIFDWFTPKETGHHFGWWTLIFTIVEISIFTFMAGEFNLLYRMTNETNGIQSDHVGPDALGNWLIGADNEDNWQTFSFEYLKEWGGRYAPSVYEDGQHYRWLTSIFIHSNMPHISSNMFLFIALSSHLENKYGTIRIFGIWLLSGVGGNMFSALFEDNCTLTVGASGSVFGMFGLYVADMLLNFESITNPLMRGMSIIVFLIYFFWTLARPASAVPGSASCSRASLAFGLVQGHVPESCSSATK
ncbi:hypothetical protein CYMTET_8437 [Cymbomonas tetramitiformis]|uniref:RHOMBOID-like protein n=1 Tax=Cymbomonas tetramitiformis TaxID=36881 RepID=A0AAE0GTI6_9CHLO|nr:hypothetical protein CYMTET_8437 [Cymbomonas tetramitiformis]